MNRARSNSYHRSNLLCLHKDDETFPFEGRAHSTQIGTGPSQVKGKTEMISNHSFCSKRAANDSEAARAAQLPLLTYAAVNGSHLGGHRIDKRCNDVYVMGNFWAIPKSKAYRTRLEPNSCKLKWGNVCLFDRLRNSAFNLPIAAPFGHHGSVDHNLCCAEAVLHKYFLVAPLAL